MADVVHKIKNDGVFETADGPQGVYYNGKTFFGSVTTTGYGYVSCYNHTTGRVTTFNLGYIGVDSHCCPVLWVRPDGKIVAFWSAHTGATLYWRITSYAGDISTWASTQSKAVTNITYPTPVYLSDESTLYLFFRGGPSDDQSKWSYVKSSDNGETFGDVVEFFLGAGALEYLKIVSDGVGIIHFVNSCNPNQSPSVYHFYYDGGNFYQTDGTLIGDIDDFPILHSEATVVYDSGDVGHYDAFRADIALLAGSPVILFVTYVDVGNNDIRLNYAKWSGSAWLFYEVSAINYVIVSDPYDTGSAMFNQDDPTEVWFSKEVSSILEVFKAVTSDGGETWTPMQITSGSSAKNFRIRFVVDNVDTFNVFWARGTWTNYTNYNTDVYGLLSDSLPTPKLLLPAAPVNGLKPLFGTRLKLGHPIARGLIALWPFNEGSGDIHNDALGNPHGALTVGGGSTWTLGPFGPCRSFNGSDQNLRWPAGGPTAINGANAQITILVWAKLNSLVSGHLVNKYLATTGNRQYQFYYNNGIPAMQFVLSSNGTLNTAVNSTAKIADLNFHQLVAVCDDITMRQYCDGLLDTTPVAYTTGIFNGPQDFRIGSSPSAGSWWNGLIDHVAIWNRALSAEEIAQLYFEPFCMFGEGI